MTPLTRRRPTPPYQLAAGHKLPDAANRLGVIYASSGRVNEAFNAFNQALRHDPENFGVYRNRGLLRLELLGDPEDEGGELELLGGVALGIDGGWGVVGLLALGQPVSSTQADTIAAKPRAGWRFARCLRVGLLGNFVGMNNSLSAHWLKALKSRAKPGSAQLAH